jgi:hypothetical protein
MKQKQFWLKILGTAILLHIVLILLSILEVIIYSYLINPGHNKEIYEAHATQSGPWISYIFGSLFVFLIVKRYINRFKKQQLLYALALPIIYSVIDYIIFSLSTPDVSVFVTQFIIGKAVKILAGIIAYFIYSKRYTDEQYN